MSVSEDFKALLTAIAIDNVDTIALRYGEITCALNQQFRDADSKTANSLQVGSYGRWTAIKGVSDLDMLYILPAGKWESYKDGGQSRLLSDTCAAVKARYPRTEVFVDSPVVRVLYKGFHIEVQPVFELTDGGFYYPDTKNGGSWKTTKPKLELQAMKVFDAQKNKNLRRMCKMARAWKNKHGVAMGGLLIDTLAHNFLKQTDAYDALSYGAYDEMSRDFFDYLQNLPDQDYFEALGSGQRVKVKKRFQKKAKKAFELAEAAIAAAGQAGERAKWRKVFGRGFPAPATLVAKAFVEDAGRYAKNTEQFIEDMFAVDIRYPLRIDCEVTEKGFRPQWLRELLASRKLLNRERELNFSIVSHGLPLGFVLYWKVLNRGAEAVRRDCIRGQILADMGQHQKSETSRFRGEHVVESYAVINDVVVAKDRIRVPIQE